MATVDEMFQELKNKLRAEGYQEARAEIQTMLDTITEMRGREKELLAVNAELIDGNHAAHVALDEAGIKREDVVWEGSVQHVTEYPVCDRIKFLAERETVLA